MNPRTAPSGIMAMIIAACRPLVIMAGCHMIMIAIKGPAAPTPLDQDRQR
jgi:hypothetical protein